MGSKSHLNVITIDGPAGSGKSTVARNLAKSLGVLHLNSGALYRAVALEANRRNIDLADESRVCEVARSLDFRFENNGGETILFVNGRDTTAELRGEEVGQLASKIAVLGAVREVLNCVQRRVAESSSLVLEGRDAGTVVFPDAPFKFFLDATLDTRANRRFKELQGRGESRLSPAQSTNSAKEELVTFDAVKRELASRDKRDSSREIAPQKAASDAVVIDTSEMTVDQVVARIADAVLRTAM